MHGPVTLQRNLLNQLLLEEDINIGSVHQGSYVIKDRLCHKKVLVVLDDVDSLEQLNGLARKPDWFGPGSRIIVTTRNKHLLLAHDIDTIYEVKLMDDEVALQLFCWHAFKQNHPIIDFAELSKAFVSYAGGLPLVLKILGSILRNKSLLEWKSALKSLQDIPPNYIMSQIKITYDELEDIEKQAFLDIACFFDGEDTDVVRNILEASGLYPEGTMTVLSDKGLLSFTDRKLSMHELIRKMGREIVRQESIKKPGRRSRLWNPDDISHVLTEKTGTELVEVMSLDMSKIDTISLPSTAFAMMDRLRVLEFYNSESIGKSCNVNLPEGLEYLSNELIYLQWHTFPLKSLPFNFYPQNLAVISLRYNKIEELWAGKRRFPNLRSIDLSYSSLISHPDLSEAGMLERINLEDCKNLVDVSTIQYLRNLEHLNMKGCANLGSLPSVEGCIHLMTLDLSGCLNLKELPELSRSIKYLYLGGMPIEKLPTSMEFLLDLVALDLRNCTSLRHLPKRIYKLESLRSLNITGCLNISATVYLNTSCLTNTNLVRLQSEKLFIWTTVANMLKGKREWFLLFVTTILEVASAVSEQLKYFHASMVMAIIGLLCCVGELCLKAREKQATLEYFGLVAVIWQLIHSILGYICHRHNSQNPIQTSLTMVLFCLCRLTGKIINKISRATPQPGSNLEMIVVQN